ncbi:hypothetical protein EW146_g5493 [Bondarzewia mesenterica]|uniref:Uncharacterized protein n=1 Tax=Bondarzewia mesenterica TaxID=1095465 RepID=A0A4S4LTE3_9AGAM|nr:hypothetical protein EW146_g5493 [Bondarzewia mesenterica]
MSTQPIPVFDAATTSRGGGRHEQASSAPSPVGSSPQSTPHLLTSSFVGSPQQLNAVPETFPHLTFSLQHDSVTSIPSPSHPGLGARSMTSPSSHVTSSHRERTTERDMHTESTFRRLTRRLSKLPQTRQDPPEWSVFGQLMEHETPQGSRNSAPRLNRRISSRAIPRFEQGSLPNPRTSSLEPALDLGRQSGIQSPVSDLDLESEFPFNTPSSANVPHESSDTSESDFEHESDSDSPHSSAQMPQIHENASNASWSVSSLPTLPTLYRNILKCSIAYFLASLFTYSPYLSGLISAISSKESGERYPSPSGHMVATVAVYFNPAKTIGGMVEADRYCLMGLAFAAFISLGSMNMYWWFEVKHGWEWLADILAILWIGVGMTFMAWMKLWMAKPTFNTACSMTAIILFVVVVKEGGVAQLLQVSLIIFTGSIISNLVCYSLWPQSATINLQTNMIKTLDSYSTLLKLLTSTFLLEQPLHHPRQEKIQKAVTDHQASFTSLKKNIEEARSESVFGGAGDGLSLGRKGAGPAYEDAVDSLNRLAQHLNGLRSGTSLQYELAKAHQDGRVASRSRRVIKKGSKPRTSETVFEVPLGIGKTKAGAQNGSDGAGLDEDAVMLRSAATMFGDMVDELGPPLRALSSTCTNAIRELREAFIHRNGIADMAIDSMKFMELADGIERALFTFESTSNHAVLRLYRRSDASGLNSRASGSIYSLNENKENTILSGSDNENVFLVYFFIFTLQEFARELISLVDAMGRVYAADRARAAKGWWFKRIPGRLLGFFRACMSTTSCGRDAQEQRPKLRDTGRMSIQGRLSSYLEPDKRSHISSSFPKIRPHAPNTVQTPARAKLSAFGRFKQSLWTLGDRMRDRKVKYAVKSGMATAMLAAPAFFEATRPTFLEYRGEWALISFFVVMSPTIGATNFMSIHRVLGTLFGAATAATIYSFFPENAVVLSIFGFFYSVPCFYYIVSQPQYATTGRYNTRLKDVSVIEVALHRSVAVTVGVVWAFFVSRFWWPSEARRELSKALGEFCLNVGWLYTRLVASNSFSSEANRHEDVESDATEQTFMISKQTKTALDSSIEEFMAMEFHLQIKLIELQDLLKQTQREPRLKGPFPITLYRSILTSLQKILDNLHSMRCVTTREEWYTSVRRDFILPVNRERREMVGNIILYFSTLASAFRLKAPLPPYLPPAEKARQQLVDAIRNLNVVKNRDAKGSRQLLFFAYALTMKGITKELDFLGATLQDAFGVIGPGTDAFEALFRDDLREADDAV